MLCVTGTKVQILTPELATATARIVCSLLVSAVLLYVGVLWVRRRHGTLLRYLRKKNLDFELTRERLQINPPPGADYPVLFFLCIFVLVFLLFQVLDLLALLVQKYKY